MRGISTTYDYVDGSSSAKHHQTLDEGAMWDVVSCIAGTVTTLYWFALNLISWSNLSQEVQLNSDSVTLLCRSLYPRGVAL